MFIKMMYLVKNLYYKHPTILLFHYYIIVLKQVYKFMGIANTVNLRNKFLILNII